MLVYTLRTQIKFYNLYSVYSLTNLTFVFKKIVCLQLNIYIYKQRDFKYKLSKKLKKHLISFKIDKI